MINLKNVTLVAVACIRVNETMNAIRKSMSGIEFGDVKLITSENVYADDIKIINIPYLDYENYNKFIVYELHKYVDTDFVLIVQDDGYVINPNMWRDEFFRYDYIGAPWALPNPDDTIGYRDVYGNIVRVGNGGFSFRSKKLLEIPTKLNLEWRAYYGYFNEDGFFTCHNRHLIEKEGCVYAPIDVAKYFSHESDIPEVQGIVPFGFHGKWSKYYNM